MASSPPARSPAAPPHCTRGWTLARELPARGHRDLCCVARKRPAAGWLTNQTRLLRAATDRQTDTARGLAPSQCCGRPRAIAGDGAALLCGRRLAGELALRPHPSGLSLGFAQHPTCSQPPAPRPPLPPRSVPGSCGAPTRCPPQNQLHYP